MKTHFPKTLRKSLGFSLSLPLACGLLSTAPLAVGQEGVLEEVIVTARKREEAIQSVPVSITAFSGEQLRTAGITNIKHMGYLTPGVQIDPSSTAQIWIRGIGQRDDGARVDGPVGVYLDGLYLPRKDGQLLDLLDVQSVQVLRGPQGTLFGKNTTAGALIISSRRPAEQFGGFMEARVGNYDRLDARASFDLPVTERLLTKVTLASTQRDGIQENIVNGDEAFSEDRKSAALQLAWRPSDSLLVDAFAYYGETREVQPATNCRWMTDSSFNGEDSLFGNRILPGDTIGIDPFDDDDTPVIPGFVDQSPTYESLCRESTALEDDYKYVSEVPNLSFNLNNLLVGLTLEWTLSDNLTLKSITGYGDQDRFGNAGNPDNDATRLPISARYRASGSYREHWSQELQLSGTAFDERLSYTLGLFAMEEDIDDGTDTNSGIIMGSFIPGANVMIINDPTAEDQTYELKNTTRAAFFQASYEVTDHLELTVGARWTSEKREQTVDLELLDQQAFRDIAFPALEGIPGVLLTIPSSGIAFVDPDVIFQQDVFTLLNQQFGTNPDNGLPQYALLPPARFEADKTWDEVTPMVSLAYHLPDTLIGDTPLNSAMLYATYAEGFKSGTFEPVGLDGQAQVDPELVDNYEFGFKLDLLNSSMRLNGAIFQTDFDGMQLRQVVADSTATPRVILRNASKTEIRGFELEWTWAPTERLLLNATASVNDYEYLEFTEDQFSTKALFNQEPLPTVDRTDEPFAEVPEKTWTLGVQYRIDTPVGTFLPRLDYSYVDDIFMGLDAGAGQNEDQSTFDDYGLFNARVAWMSPSGQFEAAAWVTNLTDEQYYFGAAAVGDSVGVFQTTVGMPRMYGMEFRYNLH